MPTYNRIEPTQRSSKDPPMAKKGDMAGGILYIIVGVLLLGLGGLGISFWSQAQTNPERPLLKNPTVTMKTASIVLMPVGFVGGLGLAGFGVVRLRGGGAAAEGEESEGA
jgi:hypothetical protein